MSEKRFRGCVRGSIEEFIQYDRDADIVTCWENFARTYERNLPKANFDRFPTISENVPRWAEPNFTLYFDQRYGIAFETIHDISDDAQLFNRQLKKLQKLDEGVKFETRTGESVEPDIHDICLIVDSNVSQTLGERIEEAISEGDLDVDSNIIVLEFAFIQDDIEPYYRFKRLVKPDMNFRDDSLPERGRLSKRFSINSSDERFENLQIELDEDFTTLKATGLITNSAPSDLYLACRLWDTVLYSQLDEDEKEKWRKGDPKKTIELMISVPDLCQELNEKYIPGATIRERWIINALEYIAIAKEAEQVGEKEFRVQYRNLQDYRRAYKDTTSARSEVSDLAWLLSEWHCETMVKNSQREIAEIITADSYEKADLSGIAGAQLGDF